MIANVQAEASVLGAILLNQKAYDEAAACGLQHGDFSLDSHRRIFQHMGVLAESARPIDLITLVDQLATRQKNWSALVTSLM